MVFRVESPSAPVTVTIRVRSSGVGVRTAPKEPVWYVFGVAFSAGEVDLGGFGDGCHNENLQFLA